MARMGMSKSYSSNVGSIRIVEKENNVKEGGMLLSRVQIRGSSLARRDESEKHTSLH